jgi:hypothetical protein
LGVYEDLWPTVIEEVVGLRWEWQQCGEVVGASHQPQVADGRRAELERAACREEVEVDAVGEGGGGRQVTGRRGDCRVAERKTMVGHVLPLSWDLSRDRDPTRWQFLIKIRHMD